MQLGGGPIDGLFVPSPTVLHPCRRLPVQLAEQAQAQAREAQRRAEERATQLLADGQRLIAERLAQIEQDRAAFEAACRESAQKVRTARHPPTSLPAPSTRSVRVRDAPCVMHFLSIEVPKYARHTTIM